MKWTLLPRAGQTNPLSDPLVEKKSCATREKHLFYSCGCYPRFARASSFTLAKYIFLSLVAQCTISVLPLVKSRLFYTFVRTSVFETVVMQCSRFANLLTKDSTESRTFGEAPYRDFLICVINAFVKKPLLMRPFYTNSYLRGVTA